MRKGFTYFFLSLSFIWTCSTYAQVGSVNLSNSAMAFKSNFVASGDVFGSRVFIENKGQFGSKLKNGEKIVYAYDNGDEHIYFTGKGVVYELRKSFPITERQKEAIEEGKSVVQKPDEVYLVTMNWHGATTESISIEAGLKQSHYITYGEAKYNSSTYKKITYKNIYANIDVEYSIPEDKGYGVKYSFILHPGSKATDIKMLYAGDLDKVKQNKAGEIIIKTPLDDIVEHVPSSYTSDSLKVNSIFSLRGDTLGFVFPEGYDSNKTLIIDPWVVTISSLASNTYAYDVDYDFSGNTFIYGGSSPYKIAFYNSLGVLIWTFSGTVVSPAFSTGMFYISNFAVDKFTSKSYTGQGFVVSGAQVIRLDAFGNYDNYISTPNGSFREIWEFGFRCLTAEVYILGGGTSSNICAATINSVTSALNVTTFNPLNPGGAQDIVCNTIDDQGNIFVVYAGAGAPGVSNKLCRVNAGFNNNLWLQPTGYPTLYELGNKNAYGGALIDPSNGFNCLAVNGNYLYFYDGSYLAAYNKTTGTVVASTSLPGFVNKHQGGIAVDDCDNLYIGGVGNIVTFHFNGTSFATLTPIALSTTLANQYVFDIKLNKNTKTLYVCGSGFVGTYQASISNTCATGMGLCSLNQGGAGASSTSITCASLGSATVTANGGIGPFTYTWIPSGQTGSVAVGLSPGIYTVIVYDSGYNVTYNTTVLFTSLIPLGATLNYSGILNCNGAGSGTANISAISGGSGSQSYLWTNGLTTQTTSAINGLSAGNYSVTVTDALTGCVFTQSFVISQPLAMNLFMSVSSPTACVGDSITVAGMNTGGSPPYTYTWTAGPPSSTYQVTHALGGSYTYTLNSIDNVGCPISSIATITFVPKPSLTVSNASICPLTVGTMTVLGASSYTWASTTLSLTGASFTASPLVNTQYTVIGSALGCTSVAYPSIILYPIPTPIFTSNSPRCNGQNLQLNASGGVLFNFDGPQSFVSNLQSPVISSASPLYSGVYNLTVTSVNGCTASTSQTLTVNPTPSLSVAGATVCTSQTLNLNSSSVAGATYLWIGAQNFSSTLQNPFINNPSVLASGSYSIKVLSPQNCSNTAIVNVSVIPPPSLTSNLNGNGTLCAQAFNGSPNSITLTAGGAATYTLATPQHIFTNNPNGPSSPLSTLPPYTAGLATATLTGSNGVCTAIKTVTFTVIPNPSLTVTSPTPVICIGKTFTYTSAGANSYTWGPGTPGLSTYTGPSTIASPTVTSVYSVIGGSLGCNSGTQTSTITINPLPTVSITPKNPSICLGDKINLRALGNGTSFDWSPNLALNTTTGAVVSAGPITQQNYQVMASLNSCTQVAMVTVSIIALPEPEIILPRPRLCLNEVITLIGKGGDTFNWTAPNNLLYAGQTVSFVAHSLTYGGTYILNVIDGNNCKNKTTVDLIVDDLPYGSLIPSSKYNCVPFTSEFVFDSNTKPRVNWTLESSSYTGNKFSHLFTVPGEYLITGHLQDTNTNCVNTLTILVNAYPVPKADFKFLPEKPVESLETVIFTNNSTGHFQNKWNWFFIANNGFKSANENTTYFFQDAGLYPVAFIVQNKYGCSDTIVKTIKVESDFNIYVPNAFTPNADELNDIFLPILRGTKFYTLSIFDRWGAKLFETNNTETGWDGTYKGEEAKLDVYVWKINVSSNSGEQKTMTGQLTLTR